MGDEYGYRDRGWDMGYGMSTGGWVLMTIVIVLLVALLAGLVYLIARGPRAVAPPQPPVPPGRSAAETALDERFARGEIDEDEYRRRMSVLHAR